jgi:hypothetical protein
MLQDAIISADSHMTEPPDLWIARIERQLKERAPVTFSR